MHTEYNIANEPCSRVRTVRVWSFKNYHIYARWKAYIIVKCRGNSRSARSRVRVQPLCRMQNAIVTSCLLLLLLRFKLAIGISISDSRVDTERDACAFQGWQTRPSLINSHYFSLINIDAHAVVVLAELENNSHTHRDAFDTIIIDEANRNMSPPSLLMYLGRRTVACSGWIGYILRRHAYTVSLDTSITIPPDVLYHYGAFMQIVSISLPVDFRVLLRATSWTRV